MTRRQRGFTLVEVLIALTLLAAGLLVLYKVLYSNSRMYRTQSAELNITAQARTVLDEIDNYTRQATRTVATHSTYTAGPQTLILEIQTVNSSQRLVGGKYDYIVYSLSGTVLSREIFADAMSARVSGAQVIAKDVSSLSFTYNNADYDLVTDVATSITVSESVNFQTRSFSANTISKLRNH